MKKTIAIFLCLGCIGVLGAQNIWKPLNIPDVFLGVSSDGSIFAFFDGFSYGEIARSQDEGETWQVVFSSESESDVVFPYYMDDAFAISEEGRIFVGAGHLVEDEEYVDYCYLLYSDDNGDTWQQTSEFDPTEFRGIAAPTNDIIVVWSLRGYYTWTIDGGATWNSTSWAPPHDGIPGHLPHELCDVIVNASGDLYASYLLYSDRDAAVAQNNVSHMSSWGGLGTFGCAVIWDMEFGSDGNAYLGYIKDTTWICGNVGYLQGDSYYVFAGQSIAVSDNGVVYRLRYIDDTHVVLNYSQNNANSFFDVGEAMEIHQPYSSLFHDGNIYKGKDNYLYFHGNGQYWKSIPDANDIPSLNANSEWYFTGNQFNVYPNPTEGMLFVQTRRATSLQDQTYRITNLMGQTLLSGQIIAETQQIDVSKLPEGMYFITIAGETWKFMVR